MRPARKLLLRHGFAVTLEFCRLVQALEPPAPVRCIIAVNDTNGTFRRAALPSSTATPTARPRSRPRPWPRPARACGCWTSTARMQLAMAEWLRGRVAVAERAFAASITGRRAMGERSGRGCYWPGQKARQPRPGQARRRQPHRGSHPGPPARPDPLISACQPRRHFGARSEPAAGPLRCQSVLEERSVTVHVARTREAVKPYNDLAEGALVAGLFHSQCSQCRQCGNPCYLCS